jgi:hypothetical protein
MWNFYYIVLMNKKREIQITGGKVSFAKAENNDMDCWLTMSWQKRLEESEDLRKSIWIKLDGKYPKKIKKVGGKKIIANHDEDDF